MLKLDIGCGGRGSRYEGFVGVDVHPRCEQMSANEYVRLDFVAAPIPWPPGSVDEAVALHVIEHMKRQQGLVLMQRARALLKPSAFLTVTCPDLRLFAMAYLDYDEGFWDYQYDATGRDIWPGATLADRLNWMMHEESHMWAYDRDSLEVLAREAGWTDIRDVPKSSPYLCKAHETGIVCVKGLE